MVYHTILMTTSKATSRFFMLFNLSNIDQMVEFLVRKRITPNQLFFCHLLLTKDYKNLYKYTHEFKRVSKDEIQELEDKGYIFNQDVHSRDSGFADMYVVTELLTESLMGDKESMGEEFWKSYPSFIYVNDQKVAAKSTDKDLLVSLYTDKIKRDPVKHQVVLRCLEYAKSHNLINMGILKWVQSHQWESLEELLKPTSDDTNEF